MGILKNLFDKLNNSEYCRFTENGIYLTEESNRIVELRPKELLEVGRTYPNREQVMIAYFGETPTRVLYFGENTSTMWQTLRDLKLPRHSSNVGEIVFKHFRQHLEEYQVSTKSISLEQRIPSGKEFQFELIAKKLVHVYNDHSINESFYAALRNDTVEGSLSRI